MRLRLRGCWLLPLAALGSWAARAQTSTPALTDDLIDFSTDAADYNLITFGNTTLGTSSITQGGIGVGGNLTVSGSGAEIASSGWSPSTPSLYVGGSTLSISGTTTLENGTASMASVTGWTWSSGSKEIKNSSHSSDILKVPTSTDPLTNSWTPTYGSQSTFGTIVTALDGTSATGTISVVGGALTFTAPVGQTSGVVVYDLDASSLNSSGNTYGGTSFTSVAVDVPAGLNYVINLVGFAANQTLFSGVSFTNTMGDNQLLWNFETSASTFTLDNTGTFYGSILATDATIDDTAATVSGQVVTDTFDETGSSQDLDATAFSVIVPEAPTFAWWALGLCGIGILVRRRLSRRRRPA